MAYEISRRDLIKAAGAGVLSTGLGGFARADTPPPGSDAATTTAAGNGGVTFSPAVIEGGTVIQPRRELAVLRRTQVLVVGGGPAGVAAAIAARRTGADVTLVERYGHFGGLWTGGLVLLVMGHMARGGKQVCLGIGEEMMQRLEKLDGGIINRRPGTNPTVDAEALKYLMVEMITEAGVNVLLHSWGVDAVMEGRTIRGIVFESKSGRQAILADQVIDATGDGDVFAAAGAAFELIKYDIGLVCRIGNLDAVDEAKTKASGAQKPRNLGIPTPLHGVNWVNMRGPAVNGLDVEELTRLELAHRRAIWKSVETIRQTPGYEKVSLVETAPQLGVRITRLLKGMHTLSIREAQSETPFPDVVAVAAGQDKNHGEWQIPYGSLVPQDVDNVLAAGRCVSADFKTADVLRLIPVCFATGHAAGVAAALAVKAGCAPRNVHVGNLQRELHAQNAYLG